MGLVKLKFRILSNISLYSCLLCQSLRKLVLAPDVMTTGTAPDQVLACGHSAPATFPTYRHTAALNWQCAPTIDAVILTNAYSVPVKWLLRTHQALEQLHRVFSYWVSIREWNCLLRHSASGFWIMQECQEKSGIKADRRRDVYPFITSMDCSWISWFLWVFRQKDNWAKSILRVGDIGIQFCPQNPWCRIQLAVYPAHMGGFLHHV